VTVSNDRFPNDDGDGEFAAGLDRARAAIDAEIARSAATARVTAAVFQEVGLSAPRRLHWFGIAAAMVIAAGLGGLFEANRLQAAAPIDMVVLDPLTFGAVAVDQ
jgi:hypothetical protein